jgi:hypothetical protein
MQDINIDELENVTGGAGVLDNMGTGADRVSNKWANNTKDFFGGNNPVGYVAGGFAGIAGGLVGLGWGFGHSVFRGVPMPQR